MLLKDADDRSVDLVELEGLLELKLSRAQRAAVEREIWNVRRGIAGERDAAHYLDAFFHDSEQTVVIHDLRLEMDGRAVQIDHLLLTRFRTAYVLETKNYGGRLFCNDRGEWSAYYGAGKGVRFDIPSPPEQARRHVLDLQRWFRMNGLTVVDKVEPIIVVPPDRPVPRRRGDDDITFIKADNIRRWWQEQRDHGSGLAVLWRIATRLSVQDLVTVAEALIEAHVPSDRDWNARFGISPASVASAVSAPQARSAQPALPLAAVSAPIEPVPPLQAVSIAPEPTEAPAPAAPPLSPETPAPTAPSAPPAPAISEEREERASTADDRVAQEVFGEKLAAGGAEIQTPHGVVTVKQVGDGRLALRHVKNDALADHVRAVAAPVGEWQSRFRNWLLPVDALPAVMVGLQGTGEATILNAEAAPQVSGEEEVILPGPAPIGKRPKVEAEGQKVPFEVSTPYGVVTIKRVTDGRYALRHDGGEELIALVRGSAKGRGEWKPLFRNWLVPADRIEEVIALLSAGLPIEAPDLSGDDRKVA